MSLIGYCPQTNAVHEELTAYEMLHLLATLRGLRDPQKHVEKWISILGTITRKIFFSLLHTLLLRRRPTQIIASNYTELSKIPVRIENPICSCRPI